MSTARLGDVVAALFDMQRIGIGVMLQLEQAGRSRCLLYEEVMPDLVEYIGELALDAQEEVDRIGYTEGGRRLKVRT